MRMHSIAMMLIMALVLAGCAAQAGPGASAGDRADLTLIVSSAPIALAGILKDGVYEAKTAPDSEKYYVKGAITVQGGRITAVEWAIYDAARDDLLFDKDYEAVFDNAIYKQQCRDNLTGMADYATILIEEQDIESVDAVTGATWAHTKFEEWVNEALKQAIT